MKKGKVLALVVLLISLGLIIGLAFWGNALPEKSYKEINMSTVIEDGLTEEGFGNRIEIVDATRNHEERVEEVHTGLGGGAGVGIGIGTTDFIPKNHERFVALYLESKNHFRDELVMIVKEEIDERFDTIKGEQHFAYIKHYGTRSENGGNFMNIKNVYRYQPKGKHGREFNIEKVEGNTITFVHDPAVGHICGMIALGTVIMIIVTLYSLALMYRWGYWGI